MDRNRRCGSQRARRGAWVLALTLVVAGCGDDAVDASASTAPPTSVTTTTTMPIGTSDAAESAEVDVVLPGATVHLAYDGDQLCATTTSEAPFDAVHVHASDGAEVVDLLDGNSCVTIGAEGGVIFADPGSYYVDVHAGVGVEWGQLG